MSANPKMYVRRHEAQQKIIFQFIVHRCEIRIIALTESLKETDFILSIHNNFFLQKKMSGDYLLNTVLYLLLAGNVY